MLLRMTFITTRRGAALMAAASAGLAASAAPALADDGSATLAFDASLLRARIAVAPTAPATRGDGGAPRLPVRAVDDGGVALDGGLRLRSGRRTLTLSRVQVTTAGAAWGVRARASRGGTQTLFAIRPGASAPERSATATRVSGASLRLTATGARVLNRALKPRRALRPGTVGTIDVDARRTTATARPLAGGTVTWGYSPALRQAFQATFGALMTGGVTQDAAGAFVLPVTGGTWDAPSRRGVVTTTGSFRAGYQMAPSDGVAHGIWVKLEDVRVTLDGDRGTITARSDSGYHGVAPAPVAERTIATLDLTGVAPAAGPDGTLTWSAIPATIAAGGEELVASFRESPGRPSLGDVRALDPVTISVRPG